MRASSLITAFCLLFAATVWAADGDDQRDLLKKSVSVLEEIMDSPEQGIPGDLLGRAKAIIIFPTMLKGGFILAARYGTGIATARGEKSSWSAPAFMMTMGGSVGLQAGAEAVDLVLLIMTQRGLEGVLQDRLTLGGDVAIAAGPIGRHAEAAADIKMQGEIYAYSRSKGIFGGISLDGTVLMPDKEANETYYGASLTPQGILLGNQAPITQESTKRFLKQITKLAPPS